MMCALRAFFDRVFLMTKTTLFRSKARLVIAAQSLVLLFAIASVVQKFAGAQDFPSLLFFVLYLCAIVCLFIYALGWQQVLKYLPLAEAYSHRSMTVIWSLIFGSIFFNESITISMLLGAILIIVGVYLVQTDLKVKDFK